MFRNVLVLACVVLAGCATPIVGEPELYTATVDYSLSVKETLEFYHYDCVDRGISDWNVLEWTPVPEGQQEVSFGLVHFNASYFSNLNNLGPSTSEVLVELDKMGYRPATFAELCAFGVKCPDKQKRFLIVALGSAFLGAYGKCNVTFLYWEYSVSYLNLCWIGGGIDGWGWWLDDWRFLVVPK